MNERKKVLFLGASITQGKISISFVKSLKQRLGTKHFKFINQGVAGYESYNILKKIDKTIKLKVDFVIILVGTNDILSALDPRLSKLSRKLKNIPHEPSLFNFSKNITEIVKCLKQKTHSKIAIASLPILGENLYSIENKTISEYNSELKRISEIENAVYLPVFEKQEYFLKKEIEGKGKDCINGAKMAFKSLVHHYLFFKSLDSISKHNGFLLLTDGIHMNSMGSSLIADEIEQFIRSELRDKI